ncbi:hypothetical protein CMEL01_07875 [Colletotrichum melonis]|uniref:Uncharacterized protein n=1 Tax=Colletotrichum melonis TaxID=1209925 RepID=A0AAI9XHQ6_9PEZI|nr:hypothetical protein CMEL01_07875 [Colletotrichum melonis]
MEGKQQHPSPVGQEIQGSSVPPRLPPDSGFLLVPSLQVGNSQFLVGGPNRIKHSLIAILLSPFSIHDPALTLLLLYLSHSFVPRAEVLEAGASPRHGPKLRSSPAATPRAPVLA